jgi:hypothetical protein
MSGREENNRKGLKLPPSSALMEEVVISRLCRTRNISQITRRQSFNQAVWQRRTITIISFSSIIPRWSVMDITKQNLSISFSGLPTCVLYLNWYFQGYISFITFFPISSILLQDALIVKSVNPSFLLLAAKDSNSHCSSHERKIIWH